MTAAKARTDYLSKENHRVSQFNRHVLDTCQKDAELIKYFQTTISELRTALSKTSLPGILLPDDQPLSTTRSSINRPTHSRCSTDRSIFRKISNMESEIKDLKEVNSLKLDQLEEMTARRRTGSRGSTSRSGSTKSAGSKKSSTSTKVQGKVGSRSGTGKQSEKLSETAEDSLNE